MAVEEHRVRKRRSLEEKLGVEETTYLMDRPPGGWSDLVTNQNFELRFATFESRFDAKLEALEHKLLAEMERRFRTQTWLMITAMFSGFGVLGAILRLG